MRWVMTIEARDALLNLELEAEVASGGAPDSLEKVQRRRKEMEGLPEQLRSDRKDESL
jgi:hypothetical protein